jgi:broad-specificity NMP kinase
LIIIFNGPPGSGKDEAASYFKLRGFKHLSFKYVLFQETLSFFGVDEEWFMNGYNDRTVKERPEDLLDGMSRREAMIYVSEVITKPAFGNDIFGVHVASEIEDEKDYAVSDGGFEELELII